MSRFDYPDPGTDPEYCNAISDDPGAEAQAELVAIEAAEHATLYATPLDASERALRDAIADFRQAVEQAATAAECERLFVRVGDLDQLLTAVTLKAGQRMNFLAELE